MLLKVLKELFTRAPRVALPADEAGYDRAMRDLVVQGRHQEALSLYDAAMASGIRKGTQAFDAAYRRALAATGTPPSPLRRRARFQLLYELLGEALPLKGEIAECGCYLGLSTHLMLSRLKLTDRGYDGSGFRVFDSFEGLSAPSAADLPAGNDPDAARVRAMCQPGYFAAPLESVRRALSEFPGVAFHPGWIPQSFADLPERRYRFVHLDLDLHDPTRAALEYFFPRLVPGAIVVCDDFNWPGERKAIEDFCARRQLAFETTPHGQAVLRRSH